MRRTSVQKTSFSLIDDCLSFLIALALLALDLLFAMFDRFADCMFRMSSSYYGLFIARSKSFAFESAIIFFWYFSTVKISSKPSNNLNFVGICKKGDIFVHEHEEY